MRIDRRIKAFEFKSSNAIIMNSMKFNVDIASCSRNFYSYNSCISGIGLETLHKNDSGAYFIMEATYTDEED